MLRSIPTVSLKLVRQLSTIRSVEAFDNNLESKLASLQIDRAYLNRATLNRLNACSTEFLSELSNGFEKFGFNKKQVALALKTYDNWSLLSEMSLKNACEMYRELAFTPEVYLEMISKNPMLFEVERTNIVQRLNDFTHFFTKNHMKKLLVRSPKLMTENFDSFRYKYTYVFVLMKINQDEMSKSHVFDRSLNTIRHRHLFLERSGFYDKPNKKGIAKIRNPSLKQIMDTNMKDYLKICTNNIFTEQDYETFGEYLGEENFDDELLGNNIGHLLEKQIIRTIRQEKYDNSLLED